MLFINLAFTIICWSIVFYLNYKFLRPALLNKERFRLFELRDQLALLVMEGKISRTSDEYKALQCLLNTSIKKLRKFSFTNYLKFLSNHVDHLRSKDNAKALMALMERQEDENFRKLVYNFYSVTNDIFLAHTRLFRYTLIPLIKLIIKYVRLVSFLNKTLPDIIMYRINKVEEIQSTLADVEENFVLA